MDQEAMKEPAASTPVWDELEEWSRGRIQEWMQRGYPEGQCPAHGDERTE